MSEHDDMIEAVARAIKGADFGYTIELTEKIGDISTYSLTIKDGSEPMKFASYSDASDYVGKERLRAKARAGASEALERAAKVLDGYSGYFGPNDEPDKIAAAIRALKGD